MSVRRLPDDFVPKVIGTENFVQRDFCVVSDVPIKVYIDSTRFRTTVRARTWKSAAKPLQVFIDRADTAKSFIGTLAPHVLPVSFVFQHRWFLGEPLVRALESLL